MPTPPPALKVLDMRLADFAWDFAWLARLCVFRMSGSDMGHRAVRVLAPFRAEKEESSLDEGDGEGKEREEEWEGGVNLNEGARGEVGEGEGGEWTIRQPHFGQLELRACALHRCPSACPFPPQHFSPWRWRFSLPLLVFRVPVDAAPVDGRAGTRDSVDQEALRRGPGDENGNGT
ncbi:hypothetical protein FIBSPDRAFT_905316 [Athelia psychrophila]|uniref:Uncharacterized protein n=1 Tax=Athelia psychrophila TaxID=1759441 RepID=A0A167TKW3_9AGAM|nr:hypothetical protein FIBSPDRAFT_905316 [Fibularhizoctonia sp. CBS 109695]